MNAYSPEMKCCHPGCDSGPMQSAMFRVSAKGESWIGACTKHISRYKKSW